MALAVLNKGDALIAGVVLSKRAAELSPHYARIAHNGRLSIDERKEAATAAETMLVALEARIRHPGETDMLERFTRRWRTEMFAAGECYAWEVRAEKSARGFAVVDQAKGQREAQLTEDELQARVELAIRRLEHTNGVLRAIAERLPRRMEKLCYDGLPWSPYDEDMLRDGLHALMLHYCLLDTGINRDRRLA